MTRYSNPLPHNQVPNTQGRPAGTGPQPAQAAHAGQQQWPAPNGAASQRPAPQQGYADPLGYALDPQTGGQQAGAHQSGFAQDLYAALRPDGYGYTQPPQSNPDPYGLAGYTAPQPAAAPQQPVYTRAPQAPASVQSSYPNSADPYASNGYGHQPAQPSAFANAQAATAQAHSYGAQGYGAQHQADASAFGGFGGGQPGGGYPAPRSNGADQWGDQALSLDARDYGHAEAGGGYGAQGQWGGDHYGDAQLDPALGAQGYHQNPQHAQQGSFDQSYAEDDVQYEDEPRRSSWKKIAAIMACTVFVGGVLTFGYSSIMGTDTRETPLVKGASGPSKVKPSEPGGKQFAHADSKIMGRLSGEGGAEQPGDASGVRKVPIVTVGRDGSIQPPPAAAPEEAGGQQEQTRAIVAVPGLTVIDGLGAGASGPSPTRPARPQASPSVQSVAGSDATPEKPVVVEPPKKQASKPAQLIANADASSPNVVQTKAVATPKSDAPAAPKKEKVAALTPPAATGPQPTGAGYVAVLASVPASGSSRMDALKQFADMQQKYSSILSNKTPDIQEANLGEKGTYHRLMVGPPGSRDSASSVCTQLKAEGYSSCWVTAY